MNWFRHTDNNQLLIYGTWLLFLIFTIGNIVSMIMWATNNITDRQMLGLTLLLSWLAMQGSTGTALLQSYTKRDVDAVDEAANNED